MIELRKLSSVLMKEAAIIHRLRRFHGLSSEGEKARHTGTSLEFGIEGIVRLLLADGGQRAMTRADDGIIR